MATLMTRRAVLSYSQLKALTKWPDLLVNDYQGILQDTTTISTNIENIEVVILEIKGDIIELEDSHYPNLAAQMQFLQKQINGLPEFTIDTTGFTFDSTKITFDKVIA